MEELKAKFDKIENIGKKVDKLEYTDMKEIKKEVQGLQLDLATNNLLTEQNTEAMNNMSKTMEGVRETMIQMSSAIECISKTNQELANNLRQQNSKIDRLQARQDKYDENIEAMRQDIKENDEKGKFDIILFLQKHLWEIFIIIYLVFEKIR